MKRENGEQTHWHPYNRVIEVLTPLTGQILLDVKTAEITRRLNERPKTPYTYADAVIIAMFPLGEES